MNTVQILDNAETEFPLAAGEGNTTLFINPDGEDVGGFYFIAKALVDGAKNAGAIVLADVPHEGHLLFVDVNDGGGSRTKIENKTSKHLAFVVIHPDLTDKESAFSSYHEAILSAKPFLVSWSFTDLDTLKPREHGLKVWYEIV